LNASEEKSIRIKVQKKEKAEKATPEHQKPKNPTHYD